MTQLTPWHNHDLAGWNRLTSEDAPSVHFLHGNGFCATTLLPLAETLPSNWNLLFTDVPGHGGSVQPEGYMPNWLGMARQIGAALEERVSKPIVGVGHSMGGVMTLMIAAEHPHLFSRIVLLDPVLFSSEIIMIQRIVRKTGLWQRTDLVKRVSARRSVWPDAASMKAEFKSKNLYKEWDDKALDAFIEYGSKDTEKGRELCCNPQWEASIFGSYPRGLWQAVRRVAVPVDILVAEHSYSFIEKSARRASQGNPHFRYQMVDGGHCFPMEQVAQTGKVLNSLLNP